MNGAIAAVVDVIVGAGAEPHLLSRSGNYVLAPLQACRRDAEPFLRNINGAIVYVHSSLQVITRTDSSKKHITTTLLH
jgi:hypothetical protein